MYPVSGWISYLAHLLSGIQPDIGYAVRYLSRYLVCVKIFVKISGIRPDISIQVLRIFGTRIFAGYPANLKSLSPL